jgi:hypothetical protein
MLERSADAKGTYLFRDADGLCVISSQKSEPLHIAGAIDALEGLNVLRRELQIRSPDAHSRRGVRPDTA